MNNIIISTESSADLPEQILKQYGIEVCSMEPMLPSLSAVYASGSSPSEKVQNGSYHLQEYNSGPPLEVSHTPDPYHDPPESVP